MMFFANGRVAIFPYLKLSSDKGGYANGPAVDYFNAPCQWEVISDDRLATLQGTNFIQTRYEIYIEYKKFFQIDTREVFINLYDEYGKAVFNWKKAIYIERLVHVNRVKIIV